MMMENSISIISSVLSTALVTNQLSLCYMYRLIAFLAKKIRKKGKIEEATIFILTIGLNVILIIANMTIVLIKQPLGEIYNIVIATIHISFIAFTIIPTSLIVWCYHRSG